MSTQDHYSINIARRRGQTDNYFHHARMVVTVLEPVAKAILADTRERYPSPEFKVTMTHWTYRGRFIDGEPK